MGEIWSKMYIGLHVKVKVTLVQALGLCIGRTAYRGSRGIALPFHGHGTRRGLGVSVTPRPRLTPGKDTIPIVQEAGWAPGPVWAGAENLAHTGIRSPDCPARSQSLYRLSYPAHGLHVKWQLFFPDFEEAWIFFYVFKKIKRISNSIKIRPVGGRVFVCGRTEWHDEAYSRFSQLCKLAKIGEGIEM